MRVTREMAPVSGMGRHGLEKSRPGKAEDHRWATPSRAPTWSASDSGTTPTRARAGLISQGTCPCERVPVHP